MCLVLCSLSYASIFHCVYSLLCHVGDSMCIMYVWVWSYVSYVIFCEHMCHVCMGLSIWICYASIASHYQLPYHLLECTTFTLHNLPYIERSSIIAASTISTYIVCLHNRKFVISAQPQDEWKIDGY